MKTTFKIILLLLLFTTTSFVYAQNTGELLTGTITDSETKEPLIGASVVIKGNSKGTTTDANGKFVLSNSVGFPVRIIVSYIGYHSQEIEAKVPGENLDIKLKSNNTLIDEITISARRREENAQDVPIPISVVSGAQIEESGAFNVNRIKELVPSVQLYSSNPRNTTLNIRGMGSTFGLTNDGIDPGVGFYVDGVYYARPAATALDFVDVDRIEVLRGPQGTLFGKNTTAGAFNITSRAASFTPGATYELSYGNYGFVQAKGSVTGPLSKKTALRISFSGTQRDGLIKNIATNSDVNDLNNLGVRTQILYRVNDNLKITWFADFNRQRPDGYAQVVAGVVTTKRAAYRQFNTIIADLGYSLPTTNPYDRIIDHNTPWKSTNDLGGTSLNIDAKIGKGTLTSTTAWRHWYWGPSNDRDFTGLSVLSLSQAPSRHEQWSQEIRYAGDVTDNISGVIGVYALGQNLWTSPYHSEESGSAQWRFSQNSTSPLWQTPGLLEGYGIRTYSKLQSFTAAAFANVDWAVTKKLHVLPGLRFNLDEKSLNYKRETYGGLETNDPALLAIKRSVYNDQQFDASASNQNFSGVLTIAYKASEKFNAYATYSTSYKPIGLNLGGLPTQNGEVMKDLALVKPEFVSHAELGFKSAPTKKSFLNVTVHATEIKDYQTLVQTPEIGVNRGYLSNAELVRVIGAELDGGIRIGSSFTLSGSFAYTDGKYIKFTNAPVPIEEVGGTQSFKDISGSVLPGISKYAGSLNGEYSHKGKLLGRSGRFFLAADGFYRSSFSSSPSASAYINIDAYALVNSRIGFRANEGLTISLWSRNLLNNNYFEQLLVAAGSAGHYAAVLGDPRTYGITIRQSF